jgi:hypothetical protein
MAQRSHPSHTTPSPTNILGLPSLHLAVAALGTSTTVPAPVDILLAATQSLETIQENVGFGLEGHS